MKDTMAGNGIVNAGGAAEASAKDDAPARYEAGQVVLAEVDHVRAYRGETDELLWRMRSAEAEEEFMGVLDGLKEPDWFVERWDGERKVLVACLVFEMAEDAGRCAKALAAAVEAGTAKAVRLRDDEGMRGEVAEWFSAKWAEAHEREMAKVGEEYVGAVKDFGGRILVGWIGGGLDKAGRKDRFERFAKELSGVLERPHGAPGPEGILHYAATDDDVLGRVNVALGFSDAKAADGFFRSFAKYGDDLMFFRIREDEGFCDVLAQMVVAAARKLRAHDVKKAESDG